MSRTLVNAMLICFFALALAGCRGGERGTLPKVAQLPPKRGEIYLVMSGNKWQGWQGKDRHRGKFFPPDAKRRGAEMPRKVSLVKVVNDTGRVVKSRPIPVSSADKVMETLKSRLARAGYQVKVVRRLPGSAERGIDVSVVSADLRQKSGLLALEGSCALSVTLDRYHRGFKEDSQRYTSTASGTSTGVRQPLFPGLMDRAAREVADQAVSGLTREI